MSAEEAMKLIKQSLDKGFDQIENGELLETDLLESVNSIVDKYFSK